MDTSVSEECVPLCGVFAPYYDVPIGALNVSCRGKLAELLNRPMPLATDAGCPRDWKGLAEQIGLPYKEILLLKGKEDPTDMLLLKWENYGNDRVGRLVEFLETMERFDVLRDIESFIEKDGGRYLREREEERLRLEAINPVQDPQVSSADVPKYNLTVHDGDWSDSIAEDPGRSQQLTYNAYVSYADSDIEFVNVLKNKLEGEYDLRLFIKDRDMLIGLVETEADIKMMHERCERIILVLSPQFFNDPKCEFQTIIAQAMQVEKNMYSRKVIPIIYKPCELPMRLRYIANLNYSKQVMFGSFWDRLYKSIKMPNQMETIGGGGGSSSGFGSSGYGGSTSQLSLKPKAHTISSIPLSPSMSSLMDIDPSPDSRRVSQHGMIIDGLSPSPTPDSGICISERTGWTSEMGAGGAGAVGGTGPVDSPMAAAATATASSFQVEEPKKPSKSKKRSSTSKWTNIFKSNGHNSN